MGKKAFLIGCNYPGTKADLPGCTNDVKRMRSCLVECFGFAEDDITVLIDTDDSYTMATGVNIRHTLASLVADAQLGDILARYTGHGTRVPAETGDDDDTGYDECIVPCYMILITDDDFRDFVNKIPAGCKITIVSDSCHSGGLIDETKEQISHGVDIPQEGHLHNHRADDDTDRGYDANGYIKSRSLPLSTLIEMLKQKIGKEGIDVGKIRPTLFNVFGDDASPKVKKFMNVTMRKPQQNSGEGGSMSMVGSAQDSLMHKLEENDEEYIKSTVYQLMLQKCQDPGEFSVPCVIENTLFKDAILDLGASINVMPKSIFQTLGIEPLCPTEEVIQLANQSFIRPVGVIKDVLVTVENLNFPADFYILEMVGDSALNQAQLILGRPFLKTSRTKIDVYTGTFSMESGDTVVQFNIDTMGCPVKNYSRIDVLDKLDFDDWYSDLASLFDCSDTSSRVSDDNSDMDDESNRSDSICDAILDEGTGIYPISKFLQIYIIYPIYDSKCMSPMQMVPKKSNVTMVINGCQTDQTSSDATPPGTVDGSYGALGNAIQTILQETEGDISNQQLVLKASKLLSKQVLGSSRLYCSDDQVNDPCLLLISSQSI